MDFLEAEAAGPAGEMLARALVKHLPTSDSPQSVALVYEQGVGGSVIVAALEAGMQICGVQIAWCAEFGSFREREQVVSDNM